MKRLCPYCMSPIQQGDLCPRCGKAPASYQPSSHHFPPGGLLRDRYLIGRALGEGGFGITYLGMDTNLERRVAVKEYFPTSFVKREVSVTMDVTCYTASNQKLYERGREQFLVEARTMAKLDKIPEIVRVLDFFPANNTAYIVMEFLEGSTLKELTAQQGRIPAKDMLEMLEPILRAMESMHAAGIIHRDISPDNLMVLKSGKVKLMDFGCARNIDGGRTMTTMLKHGFAPKEQYSGHGQGPWTDIYALCATVYYCLTGKVPPSSMERDDSDEDPLIPPTKLGAALSPSQESALLKGLAVRAKDRCQSAGSLYAALYGRTMEGYPWTQPADADAVETGETEYIHTSDKADSASRDDGEFSRTEFTPEDDMPGEDHGTEYVRDEERERYSEEDGNEQKKAAAGLLTKWKGLSRQVKAGIGGAACLVVILGAVLALWKPGPSIPAANVDDSTHQGEITPESDTTPEQTPENEPGSTDKLPGITDVQPSTSDQEYPPQGEADDHQDTEPSTQTNNNSTQTTVPNTAPTDKPNTSTGNTGTSTSKPQEPEPKPDPEPQPAKSAEELFDAGMEAFYNDDYAAAVSLLQQADDLGSSKAAEYIALCGWEYWDERGDADTAVTVLRDAHSRGASDAATYLDGIGSDCYLENQYSKALPLFQEAAGWGSSSSMYTLYLMYFYGEGVQQSDTTAFSWLMKSAQAGNIFAYATVGTNYLYGYGVTADRDEARKWFQKAVDAGDSMGQYFLDQMDQGLI